MDQIQFITNPIRKKGKHDYSAEHIERVQQ